MLPGYCCGKFFLSLCFRILPFFAAALNMQEFPEEYLPKVREFAGCGLTGKDGIPDMQIPFKKRSDICRDPDPGMNEWGNNHL